MVKLSGAYSYVLNTSQLNQSYTRPKIWVSQTQKKFVEVEAKNGCFSLIITCYLDVKVKCYIFVRLEDEKARSWCVYLRGAGYGGGGLLK